MSKPSIGVSLPNPFALREQKYLNYFSWVESAEGSPVPIVPEFQVNLDELDGILITGGGDIDPSRYGEDNTKSTNILAERDMLEIYLVRQALKLGIPVLGICRGMQIMNISLGGTLHQHLPDITMLAHTNGKEDAYHMVKIEVGTLLHRIVQLDEIEVRSHHHQAPNKLGDRLVASAHAEDGIIEAVELPDHRFFLGILWHAERMGDESSSRLIRAFVEAASKKR